MEKLKNYLVGENGFLKDSANHGKVVMISGEWGVGKTHFWRKVISKELDEKEHIYISLYGKDSLDSIRTEVIIKSYETSGKIIKDASKILSVFINLPKNVMFGFNLSNAAEKIEKFVEDKQAEKVLPKKIICFDDFERKSSKVDLNDLFGFITQLAIEFKCLVVIILNQDAFEGNEKAIFKNVKEKTVNKFFKYSPTVEELFEIIFGTKTEFERECLSPYKTIILNILEKMEERNARIIIQVLDHCLEYVEKSKEYYSESQMNSNIKTLVLTVVNFVKKHIIIFPKNNLHMQFKGIEFIENLFDNSKSNNVNKLKINNKGNFICKIREIVGGAFSSNKNSSLAKPFAINFHDLETEKTNLFDIIDNSTEELWTMYNASRLSIWENMEYDEILRINDFVQTGMIEELSE